MGAKEQQLSDEAIIRRFLQTKDNAWFSQLYRRYSGKVYAKCIGMLREEALAQDVAQEIFVKLYVSLAKFSERSKFSTWVYSVTYNYCIDVIRKRKKEQTLFAEEPDSMPEVIDDVPDELLFQMEVKRLKRVLDEIPVDDKAVLLMKYQDDLSIKDICEALGKSESAIKMKIKRAKHKTQRAYERLYAQQPTL